ncbi:MAG: CbtA family protein, partial [Steroidobacteraceae bacterium]
MLVGIVAGLLSFGFLKVYGEPQVDRAIAFEAQLDEAKAAAERAKGMNIPDEEKPELVSRQVQAGIGLFTGVMVYCAAFGGLFGLAFAFAYRRVPGALTPQGVSALLAATGFVAIYL